MCLTYITVLCVQGILILSPLLFVPSLYSTLKFVNLLVSIDNGKYLTTVYDKRDFYTSKLQFREGI